jgi:hypothetical protein
MDAELGAELHGLNERQSESLRSLSDEEALKYKRLTKQVAEKQAELVAAEAAKRPLTS